MGEKFLKWLDPLQWDNPKGETKPRETESVSPPPARPTPEYQTLPTYTLNVYQVRDLCNDEWMPSLTNPDKPFRSNLRLEIECYLESKYGPAWREFYEIERVSEGTFRPGAAKGENE